MSIFSIYATLYRNGGRTTRLYPKKLDALAFLPVSQVGEGFEILLRENPDPTNLALRSFLKYKENNYVGKRHTRLPTVGIGFRQVVLYTRYPAK